jgi:glycosyltransferase involved in cell wall biosynthesis
MYPIAKLVKKDTPNSVVFLDLDDIESITRSRIAGLYRKNGDLCAADSLETEAAFFGRLEDVILPDCERVFVASELDRKKMIERTGAQNLCLLPNVYATRTLNGTRFRNQEFTFMFIGSYGYYPNHDAVVLLCRDVIPKLKEISPVPFTFRFVGTGASKGLRSVIQSTIGAKFTGPVENVESAYAGVDAIVAPICAGGGTRVKILEAFAFGKPVVSTSIGAEGIECEDGVHLLLANTVDTIADQCLRLIKSQALRESLAHAATELLQQKYNPEMLNSQILDLSQYDSG